MGTIGDIIISSPVAQMLKNHNPDSTVTWVAQSQFRSLLDNNPNIDKVVTVNVDNRSGKYSLQRLLANARNLVDANRSFAQDHYDMCLDLQGDLFTGLLSVLSGAKHRLALGYEGASSILATRTLTRSLGDEIQIGSEYRYLITQLGISDKNWSMYVPRSESAVQSSRALLKRILQDDKYVVICPFSSREAKRWKTGYWQQIILRIRGRYQLRSIILGGENEVELANEISQISGAINLAGKTSLLEAAEIIRGAKFVVGVDTGLTHMAHAVETPTLALFGPTYPYAFAGTGESNIIHTDHYCSPCNNHPTCNKQYDCMKEISPDHVLTEIKPIMQAHTQQLNLH